MSFYNMINGMNASLALILSCVLNERIDKEIPRFRDCFMQADDCPFDGFDYLIYTRMGGGNYQCWNDKGKCSKHNPYYIDEDDNNKITEKCPYCKLKEYESKDTYLGGYDDDYDCTYRTLAFKFTSEQKALYEKIRESNSYEPIKNKIYELFPDIADKIFTQP